MGWQNVSWLIMSFIFFGGVAGLWRTYTRIKDAIAFGKLTNDLSISSIRSRMQLFRFLSLLGILLSLWAYWIDWPFDNRIWLFAIGWQFFAINHVRKGLAVLDQVK